jgi:hypothetical protein
VLAGVDGILHLTVPSMNRLNQTEPATFSIMPCWAFFRDSYFLVTAEKGKATEISYSDARSLVTFFWGFMLWQQGTCFYAWLWYKRGRTSKHSAIWFIASCFDALSITYNNCATDQFYSPYILYSSYLWYCVACTMI